jgi:hypothetical protein
LTYQHGTHICVSPISNLLYVRLTNDPESAPLLIDHYSLEVRSKERTWQPATVFNVWDIEKGRVFVVDNKNGFEAAAEVTIVQTDFAKAVTDKNIGTGESVRGLIMAERPKGYEGPPEEQQWRLKIRDANGLEGESIISHPIPRAVDKSLTHLEMKVGERQDLRKYTFVHYGDRSNLP